MPNYYKIIRENNNGKEQVSFEKIDASEAGTLSKEQDLGSPPQYPKRTYEKTARELYGDNHGCRCGSNYCCCGYDLVTQEYSQAIYDRMLKEFNENSRVYESKLTVLKYHTVPELKVIIINHFSRVFTEHTQIFQTLLKGIKEAENYYDIRLALVTAYKSLCQTWRGGRLFASKNNPGKSKFAEEIRGVLYTTMKINIQHELQNGTIVEHKPHQDILETKLAQRLTVSKSVTQKLFREKQLPKDVINMIYKM